LLAGGEPDDIARLEAAARGRRLENFHLAGFVPNAELPRYQAACNALLMPYQDKVAASSGGDIGRFLSPMKLFEYLASGRAILSSNLPVPPGDASAWTAALRRMQTDPQLRQRLAAAAHETALQYTWERRAALILQD
jgi:glycosyltransferase involved in cell wall biosynthesis